MKTITYTKHYKTGILKGMRLDGNMIKNCGNKLVNNMIKKTESGEVIKALGGGSYTISNLVIND